MVFVLGWLVTKYEKRKEKRKSKRAKEHVVMVMVMALSDGAPRKKWEIYAGKGKEGKEVDDNRTRLGLVEYIRLDMQYCTYNESVTYIY